MTSRCRARLASAGSLAVALGWLGCSTPPAGPGALLPPVAELSDPAIQFPGETRLGDQTVDQERRRVVLAKPGAWRWRGTVPAPGRLHVGAQLAPEALAAGGRLEIELGVILGGRRHVVLSGRGDGSHWLDLDADLARYVGRRVELDFVGRAVGAAPEAMVGWGPVAFGGAAITAPRPHVLLIVVDTLRADHLTSYGYRRDTAPAIDRLLAQRGATFEAAYAQAPWTLPSVASYLTSRYPGELVGGDLGSFGVPPTVQTLAERLHAAGYDTAGFVANPTLHPGNGFDRGFETFYTPPATVDSMLLHGDDLTRRIGPWLRARGGRPFFLYVHFIDPHDPYENPETPGGRSAFFPDYQGTISGRFVHGIYTGRVPLPDPANDVRQVTALYDSEIRFVDARIGDLLAAIPPETLRETLVVLTADHGEELHDHGGWKHGQTLYQEQIRVPLIARWDGRIAPGSRFAEAVRLLDLAPTLLAAAGAPADAGDEGVDLLPALRGQAALPRLAVVAEHLSSGPRRAAAILEGRKLVLFDRREPFVPADGLQEHLWRVDMARLRRVEAYDLTRDAGERQDLSAGDASAVERLQPLIHRQLDRELPGLRILASGVPAGARLDGTIRFERPPARWTPYFLGDDDMIDLDGAGLRFRLSGETLVKGALVEGDVGALVEFQAHLDGGASASVRLLVGPGSPYRGGRIESSALLAPQSPPEPAGPALRVWISARGTTGRHAEEDPETVKRLQALGYIQR